MKTVAQGFREFQTQLTTPEHESKAAQSHRASIEACLKKRFGLDGFFQSGSFGNGTNVPKHSDVDRFAVFPRDSVPINAHQALRVVRQTLAQCFTSTQGIRIKPPAVVIPFGIDGLETTEVIPALDAGTSDGHKVYGIPNPSGGPKWILSAPQALRSYINEVDAKQDNQLKPLIRCLKIWKYHVNVPLQSVYLELTCAAVARHIGLLSPSIDIARILHFMRSNSLAGIRDPFGISDPIPAWRTPGQRDEAVRKVSRAAVIASRAVTTEVEWNLKRAFRCWKALLGSRFPDPE